MVFDPRITMVLVGVGVTVLPPDESPDGLPAGQPNSSTLTPSRQGNLIVEKAVQTDVEARGCVFIAIDSGVTSSTFSSLARDGKVKLQPKLCRCASCRFPPVAELLRNQHSKRATGIEQIAALPSSPKFRGYSQDAHSR